MGFDDHVMAGVMGLTTLTQPAVEIGRAAVDLTRSVIADPDGDHQHIVLPTELVPRGSTAPPPPTH